MRKYFDKVIYVLQETTGIYITDNMAEAMLSDYVHQRGYAFIQHTIGNMPWMLMYLSDYSFDPYKQWIRKDSKLQKKLAGIKTVKFEEINCGEKPSEDAPEADKRKYNWLTEMSRKYAVVGTTSYTELSILLFSYSRIKNDNGTETEKAKFTLAHRNHGYDKEGGDEWTQDGGFYIPIDTNYFPNLIGSQKALQYRNRKLLDIANRLMPDID